MNLRTIPFVLIAIAAPALAAAQQAPLVSWGVRATSNYMFRGISKSDEKPALQGQVEVTDGFVYGGAFASTVDYQDNYGELDLVVGVTPDFGPMEVDLSYRRYLYNRDGDCCGEIGIELGRAVGPVANVTGGVFWDPQNDDIWAEAGASGPVYEGFVLGGSLGGDFGTADYGDNDMVAWDVGVSHDVLENGSVDLRYYQSTYTSARAVLSLGFDF